MHSIYNIGKKYLIHFICSLWFSLILYKVCEKYIIFEKKKNNNKVGEKYIIFSKKNNLTAISKRKVPEAWESYFSTSWKDFLKKCVRVCVCVCMCVFVYVCMCIHAKDCNFYPIDTKFGTLV